MGDGLGPRVQIGPGLGLNGWWKDIPASRNAAGTGLTAACACESRDVKIGSRRVSCQAISKPQRLNPAVRKFSQRGLPKASYQARKIGVTQGPTDQNRSGCGFHFSVLRLCGFVQLLAQTATGIW
jgi:hypothetical protein